MNDRVNFWVEGTHFNAKAKSRRLVNISKKDIILVMKSSLLPLEKLQATNL